jgi:hypothetical protein
VPEILVEERRQVHAGLLVKLQDDILRHDVLIFLNRYQGSKPLEKRITENFPKRN